MKGGVLLIAGRWPAVCSTLLESGAEWLRAVGVYCRCVPHNVTKLSDAGSARTAHSRAPDLRCFAVHSYTTAFAVLGPDSGNAVSPFIPASARTSSEQSL